MSNYILGIMEKKFNKEVVFDTISWALVLIATILFIYTGVESVNTSNYQEGISSMIGFILLSSGITLGGIGQGIKTDNSLSIGELRTILMWFVIGFLGVFTISFFMKTFYPQDILTPSATVVLLAISETVFVVGLYAMFERFSHNFVISSLSASLIWAISHIWVYGLDISLLVIILISGIIMITVYKASHNRVSVPILIHLLNNVLVVSSAITVFGIILGLGIFVFMFGGLKK